MRQLHLIALLLFPVIFTIPMENMMMIEGLGTLNRLLGLAVAPAVFFIVLSSGKINTMVYVAALCALALIVYTGLAIAWAPDMQRAYIAWFSLVQVMAMAFMIILAGMRFGPKVVCLPYILGSLYGALVVIYHGLNSASIRRIVIENFNPNWMSFLLVMAGVCIFVLLDNAGFRARLFYFFTWCLVGMAVFLLGSRGGMAFFLLISLALMFRLSLGYKLAFLLPLAATLMVFNLLIQADIEGLLMRFASAGELVLSGDLSGRGAIWGLGMAELGNPLFGAGPSGFNEIVGRAPHNAFLSVFFNLGMLGLLLFLTLWALLLFLLYRLHECRLACLMLCVALLVPMTMANWEFHKGLWFAFSALFVFSLERQVEGYEEDMATARLQMESRDNGSLPNEHQLV
ncbi:hypothetical protein [Halomonas mongoliensis]|uniref:hypothetical protein n=1 Tax=Halomonas mongoliensis TaxID=321265 RepID=UPI00403AB20E